MKELKFKKFNEEGHERMLSEEVLAQVKVIDDIFKRQQSVIDGTFIPPIIPRPPIPPTICEFVDDVTSIPSTTLGLGLASTSSGNAHTKVEML